MNNHGIDYPWLRRIRVTFEGLSGQTREPYESTGRPDGLRINAVIQKTIQGIPGMTTLTLYNLHADTRRSFVRDTTKVRIDAGWDHGPRKGLTQCFYGSLFSAQHNRSGADIVTTIKAISMMEDLARAEYIRGWVKGDRVKTIVLDIASKLKNVRVDESMINITDYPLDEKGLVFAGSARDALNRLARQYSFSWTIIDGYFQAIKEDASLGKRATIQDPYLIDINPILAGPMQQSLGIKARSTFDSSITPGYEISVESKISPELSGNGYRVNTVVHHLDCFTSNSFISDTVAFKLGMGK